MRRFVVERLEVSYMINCFVIKANLFFFTSLHCLSLGGFRGMFQEEAQRKIQDTVERPSMCLGWPGNTSGSSLAELEEVSEEKEVWASLLRLLPQ